MIRPVSSALLQGGCAWALSLTGWAQYWNGTKTEWTGGSGNWFAPANWTAGPPGGFFHPTIENTYFTLTQQTGPYIDSWMSVNSGNVSLAPGITWIYNVYGDPDGRYSIPYTVSFLSVPQVFLGDTGAAGLNVSGGMFLASGYLTLGRQAGSSGTFDVSGPLSY